MAKKAWTIKLGRKQKRPPIGWFRAYLALQDGNMTVEEFVDRSVAIREGRKIT